MDLLGLDVLDRYGLADGLIDRVHDDAVFHRAEWVRIANPTAMTSKSIIRGIASPSDTRMLSSTRSYCWAFSNG